MDRCCLAVFLISMDLHNTVWQLLLVFFYDGGVSGLKIQVQI